MRDRGLAQVSKSEQKEATRQTILQSAARLIRERGIAGASVADVMKGAKLTVGGFYAHFDSKAELVNEAIRQTGARLRERLFTRLGEKPTSDRALVILKRYLSPTHRDLETEGCPLPAIVGEVGTTAPEHAAVLGDEFESITAELTRHLADSPAMPRRQLALGLLALMYGGLALSRAVRGTPLSDELLKACRTVGKLVTGGLQNLHAS